jgi:hypothetical protein
MIITVCPAAVVHRPPPRAFPRDDVIGGREADGRQRAARADTHQASDVAGKPRAALLLLLLLLMTTMVIVIIMIRGQMMMLVMATMTTVHGQVHPERRVGGLPVRAGRVRPLARQPALLRHLHRHATPKGALPEVRTDPFPPVGCAIWRVVWSPFRSRSRSRPTMRLVKMILMTTSGLSSVMNWGGK